MRRTTSPAHLRPRCCTVRGFLERTRRYVRSDPSHVLDIIGNMPDFAKRQGWREWARCAQVYGPAFVIRAVLGVSLAAFVVILW